MPVIHVQSKLSGNNFLFVLEHNLKNFSLSKKNLSDIL